MGAKRRDVCAHLFCLGVVRVAAKRRSVATPAGDAACATDGRDARAARPELANIPDVSLAPETREALFQISAHPGCGVDAANLFSNLGAKTVRIWRFKFLAVHQQVIFECIRFAIVGPK